MRCYILRGRPLKTHTMLAPALEKGLFWTVLSDGSYSDPEALNRFFSRFGRVFFSSTIVSTFPGIPLKYQFGILTNTTEDIIISTFHAQYASFTTSRPVILNSGPVVNQLFIPSVPDSLTNNELREIISPHSQCAIYIRKDLENPNTSVAFLVFPTPTEAVHAFMDRSRWTLNGTPLEVTFTTESPLSPRFLVITPTHKPKNAADPPRPPTNQTVNIENISQITTLRILFEYLRTLHAKTIAFQIPANETVMASGLLQLQGSESLQFAPLRPSFAIDFQKPAAEAFNTIFKQHNQSDTQTLTKTVLFNSTPDQSVSNSIAPIEQLLLIEAFVHLQAQSQFPNLVPFLQKFVEVLSVDAICQSPFATDESFHIVLLTSVPFSTIAQTISEAPLTNQVRLTLAPIQLDAKQLELRTLPKGCSEDHLRTLILPHTSCTIVITPPASPSIQSSTASLVYPTEQAAIAAFRASSTWMFEGQPLKPCFAARSSQPSEKEKKTDKYLILSNLPPNTTKETLQSHLPEVNVVVFNQILHNVEPGTATVHILTSTEREFNIVLGLNGKLEIGGRKINIFEKKPKAKKIIKLLELSNLPPKIKKETLRTHFPGINMKFIDPIHKDNAAPGTSTLRIQLFTKREYYTVLGWNEKLQIAAAVQPFRVNFTFDPTGYAGAVGVREGEEVLVSGEREGGWSVVCWPDGREHGIVPSNFIERLDKLTQPVRPFEEKDNLKVDVTPSPPTPKDETPRRCFLTSKEIVKCAHLLNEPGVFYEYDKLIDFVRKNEMSPHSFQPVSLEDIVKDN
ncbi:hypothetical protein BLNAU_16402 [Blattamonas nauphoetae]|uniref:SH3 domain-containing protein n=1 Tax=Blattamonas nauphoetae TaxID=2049346 RepID=A0ABQ9X9R2_9EUKA|nr:hypothetical protein BLNAU_16402 [Blattamonas nauphoetae]